MGIKYCSGGTGKDSCRQLTSLLTVLILLDLVVIPKSQKEKLRPPGGSVRVRRCLEPECLDYTALPCLGTMHTPVHRRQLVAKWVDNTQHVSQNVPRHLRSKIRNFQSDWVRKNQGGTLGLFGNVCIS